MPARPQALAWGYADDSHDYIAILKASAGRLRK
jgi:hypothetical protein